MNPVIAVDIIVEKHPQLGDRILHHIAYMELPVIFFQSLDNKIPNHCIYTAG